MYIFVIFIDIIKLPSKNYMQFTFLPVIDSRFEKTFSHGGYIQNNQVFIYVLVYSYIYNLALSI